MNPRSVRTILLELAAMPVGMILYAASALFIDAVPVIPGSMLGISIICYTLLGTPVGVVNLCGNFPIFFLCMKILGKKSLIYTVLNLAGCSLLIDLWRPYFPAVPLENHLVIASIAGLVMGIGAGLMLRVGGTLAGTTALSMIVQKKLPRFKVGTILLCIDSIIVLAGAILLKNAMALVKEGAGVCVEEHTLTEGVLTDTVKRLLDSPEERAALGTLIRERFACPEANDVIYESLMSLVK